LPQIRHAIFIAAPTERVHELVSEPRGFSQWWSEDVTEDKAARTVDLGFFNRATVYRLALYAWQRHKAPNGRANPARNGRARGWCLTPRPKTAARCCHSRTRIGRPKPITSWIVITWGELMFRLKACAEGKAPGPLFTRNAMAY
jgi:hypothetical protein